MFTWTICISMYIAQYDTFILIYIYKDGLTLLYNEGVHSCHYFYHNFTHDSYNYCFGQQQIVTLWATNCPVLSKIWCETSSIQVVD